MPDPQVNIRISAPELAALREEAERQSRKMTDIVRDALKIYTTRNWQLLRAMRREQ